MPVVGDTDYKKSGPAPWACSFGTGGIGLGVRVVVMVMAMMVVAGGESRGGKNHQKQGSGENLFHAPNVARSPGAWKCIP